jgi:hypothetical protein
MTLMIISTLRVDFAVRSFCFGAIDVRRVHDMLAFVACSEADAACLREGAVYRRRAA